jgi:hypothetical protein
VPPTAVLLSLWIAPATQGCPRARWLSSVLGTVEVRAPRFLPRQCAATHRHTLNPAAEIMPDRCTPEYERVIAKLGRARDLPVLSYGVPDITNIRRSPRSAVQCRSPH